MLDLAVEIERLSREIDDQKRDYSRKQFSANRLREKLQGEVDELSNMQFKIDQSEKQLQDLQMQLLRNTWYSEFTNHLQLFRPTSHRIPVLLKQHLDYLVQSTNSNPMELVILEKAAQMLQNVRDYQVCNPNLAQESVSIHIVRTGMVYLLYYAPHLMLGTLTKFNQFKTTRSSNESVYLRVAAYEVNIRQSNPQAYPVVLLQDSRVDRHDPFVQPARFIPDGEVAEVLEARIVDLMTNGERFLGRKELFVS